MPPVRSVEIAERNMKRFGQVLQHFRCTDKAKARQDRDTWTPLTWSAVIGVGRKGKARIAIAFMRQFAKDRLARVTFGAVGDIGRIGLSAFSVGFFNHITQGFLREDLLETDDIGVHLQHLVGKPCLFPTVFLWGVALVFVVFLIGLNQVFDVKTGNRKLGHKVSKARINVAGSTLPPVVTAMIASPSNWSG